MHMPIHTNYPLVFSQISSQLLSWEFDLIERWINRASRRIQTWIERKVHSRPIPTSLANEQVMHRPDRLVEHHGSTICWFVPGVLLLAEQLWC